MACYEFNCPIENNWTKICIEENLKILGFLKIHLNIYLLLPETLHCWLRFALIKVKQLWFSARAAMGHQWLVWISVIVSLSLHSPLHSPLCTPQLTSCCSRPLGDNYCRMSLKYISVGIFHQKLGEHYCVCALRRAGVKGNSPKP